MRTIHILTLLLSMAVTSGCISSVTRATGPASEDTVAVWSNPNIRPGRVSCRFPQAVNPYSLNAMNLRKRLFLEFGADKKSSTHAKAGSASHVADVDVIFDQDLKEFPGLLICALTFGILPGEVFNDFQTWSAQIKIYPKNNPESVTKTEINGGSVHRRIYMSPCSPLAWPCALSGEWDKRKIRFGFPPTLDDVREAPIPYHSEQLPITRSVIRAINKTRINKSNQTTPEE